MHVYFNRCRGSRANLFRLFAYDVADKVAKAGLFDGVPHIGEFRCRVAKIALRIWIEVSEDGRFWFCDRTNDLFTIDMKNRNEIRGDGALHIDRELFDRLRSHYDAI